MKSWPIALALLALALDGCGPRPVPGAQTGPLTVLLVTSADHRADHLALAFGGLDIDTPNLDGLARRGVLFEDAWAVSTVPGASLAALHTGLGPLQTLLLDGTDELQELAQTLAEQLGSAGFQTVAVLGTHDPWEAGLCQGFQRVLRPPTPSRRRAADAVAEALAALAEPATAPLFLWLHLGDGSWPHEPSPEGLLQYFDGADDPRQPQLRAPKALPRCLPPELRDVRDLQWPKARSKAVVSDLDRALEPLFQHPRVADGVTAFVGVTGFLMGEHGIWFKRLGPYPGSLRVPLIVAAPGLSAGQRWPATVSTARLASTLLLLAGQPPSLPGAALPPWGQATPEPLVVLDVGASAAALVDGEHLLVLTLQERNLPCLLEPRTRGEPELYLLSRDSLAEANRIADVLDPQDRLMRSLVLALKGAHTTGLRAAGSLSAEERARLQSLGYGGPLPRAPAKPFDLTQN